MTILYTELTPSQEYDLYKNAQYLIDRGYTQEPLEVIGDKMRAALLREVNALLS